MRDIHLQLSMAITAHVDRTQRTRRAYAKPACSLAIMFAAANDCAADVAAGRATWPAAIREHFTAMPWRDRFLASIEKEVAL